MSSATWVEMTDVTTFPVSYILGRMCLVLHGGAARESEVEPSL